MCVRHCLDTTSNVVHLERQLKVLLSGVGREVSILQTERCDSDSGRHQYGRYKVLSLIRNTKTKDREQGTGRREAGELEICFGEKRNESQ